MPAVAGPRVHCVSVVTVGFLALFLVSIAVLVVADL